VACTACGAENAAGRRFCRNCGTALALSCAVCGAENAPDDRFCGECGAPFLARPLQSADAPSDAGAVLGASGPGPRHDHPTPLAAPVAERRVCSVLFCDLVGFTTLSESRDPEEVRELLSRYFEVARTVIGRHGGVVEKFIGDAVMAVWGTPSASEGDGERAVRAALELIDAVAQLGREVAAVGLAARAGVVTGPVAVTVGATGEGMVAGDAVNTAARVQAAAEPGSVLVDEGTLRVAEAAISFSPAGEHALKGKTASVPLWRATRVVGGTGGSQRIDGLEAGFVGRDAELRLVKELFHACEQRRTPRLVSVTGAAGVGKSRVGWEFRKYIDGLLVTVWWHQGRCLSYGDGVAFWALAEMVRQRLQIADEDSTQDATDKLAAGLETLLDDPAERAYVGPRLGQLLGVEYGQRGLALGREELFAGWRLFFERLAATGPVVMVVEDVQHADVGLLDFLEHLLDWSSDVPIFVLTLARPELESRRAGWGTARRNSTALSLDPLDDTAMDQLVEGLVPGMPSIGKAAIATRAEGIPLYAVETVRMLIDRDIVQPIDGVYRLVGDVGELAVPATLHSLLAARLDALDPDERRLVADAAVLGGTFPAEALIAVSDLPEAQVHQILAELVHREVLGVRADPLSPQRGQYGFVQTMFRQVAYDTLSRRERKARHLAVADHLQSTFADQGEEIAEVIATHLVDALSAVPDDPDVADLRQRAVAMLTRAGDRAERTGAPAAAAKAYTTAAELLDQTGTSDAEVAAAALQDRAGVATGMTGDFAVAEEHSRKAEEAYRRHGRVREAARAGTHLATSLRRQGRLEEARGAITAALEVLQGEPDADTVSALAEKATVEAFTGNIEEADIGSVAALVEAQSLDLSEQVFAELFIIRGLAQNFANRSTEAAVSLREAARRAEATQDSAAAARALLNLGDVLITVDAPAAVEAAKAARSHCRRIGHRYAMGVATANLLEALVMTGEWDDARRVHAEALHRDELADDTTVAYSAGLLYALSADHARLADALSIAASVGESEDLQTRASLATTQALAAASTGNHEQALHHARQALEYTTAISLRHDAVRWAWTMAANAALALGDVEELTALVTALDGHRPGHVPPVLRGERLRVRAGILASENDPAATETFESATRAFRDLGSPYHLAVVLLDSADHLMRMEDSSAARPLVVEAHGLALQLGATPLVDRADRLLGLLDVALTSAEA
jgi:class 3 adenylate cyclase/predicted ATPase